MGNGIEELDPQHWDPVHIPLAYIPPLHVMCKQHFNNCDLLTSEQQLISAYFFEDLYLDKMKAHIHNSRLDQMED